ncbi:probable purine permease 11 [Zingiber officinale]|uniref:Probable purine permease n=1 Tax=Zingiber officinale TaxID=94328 RepID=A0A8J5KU38_ZINOF|nr:probable purine permease 11 [Zingiber officinale]KAG6489813.1 hypothetical protein ZIOFF_051092 [Zingiber officinale]
MARPPSKFEEMAAVLRWKWQIMVAVATSVIIVTHSAGTLLGRLYFDGGGRSKWLATVVQSAGAPLCLPLLCLLSLRVKSPPPPSAARRRDIALIYLSLGFLISASNLMYSYALLYLPVSTFSLLCATQLAFNAVSSYFLNAHRFTPPVLNSVALLTFSAVLVAVGSESDASNASRSERRLGVALALAASALFALTLSLMELSFERVIKARTWAAAVEMEVWTSTAATAAAVAGLWASGEWRRVGEEMERFRRGGRAGYVMALVGTAAAWQLYAVGLVALVEAASALFANVTCTVGTALVPLAAVAVFGDEMDAAKAVAMGIAFWGFASYVYQHYLDESNSKRGVDSCNRANGSDAPDACP